MGREESLRASNHDDRRSGGRPTNLSPAPDPRRRVTSTMDRSTEDRAITCWWCQEEILNDEPLVSRESRHYHEDCVYQDGEL